MRQIVNGTGCANRLSAAQAAWVLAFLFCGLVHLARAPCRAATNVVHIVADDLGWTDLGTGRTSYGNGSAFYQTPHIDRLATEGMAFTSAYAVQTCSPTRASLMTGQYVTRTGVYNVENIEGDENELLLGAPNLRSIGDEAITIGETLQAAGYTTAHFGKFHVTQSAADITTQHGFHFDFGGGTSGGPGTFFAAQQGSNWRFGNSIGPGLDPYADPYTQEYVDSQLRPFANNADVDALVGTPKHLSDAMADAALDFLGSQIEDGSPFYMNVAFNAVHSPIEARPDLQAKYDTILANGGGVSPDPRHNDPGFAALLEGMDQAVGRILRGLEDPNGDGDHSDSIAGNTLVLFYGDNGSQGQVSDRSPLQGSKGSQLEGGLRVPLVAWMPGTIAADSFSDEPVHAVDFYPTFAELAGAPLPDRETHPLDGESVAGLLRGDRSKLVRDAVFFHLPGYQGNAEGPSSTITLAAGEHRIKLRYFYETRSFEAYDLQNDIGESNNLVDGHMTELEYKLFSRAAGQLRDWLNETGAAYPTLRADGSPIPPPAHTPPMRIDLGQASGDDLDGLAMAQLEQLGITLSLAARGADAVLDADSSGIGISSSLDTGGSAQRRRVNGQLATPEGIEFSFGQDVILKAFHLSAFNAGAGEEFVLEFLSGDNPFTGLAGYDEAGFTLGSDQLTFANDDIGSNDFTLQLGVLAQDEIFLTAGTVMSLTANSVFGGGLLLNSISVAQPLEAVAGILLDYNLDGVVDDADYVIWNSTLGSTSDLRADGNGDGVVNLADYVAWRRGILSQNGQGTVLNSSLGSATSLPEPSAVWIVLLASFAAIWNPARLG